MKQLPQEAILKSLGQSIRAVRLEKKLKQNEVAKRCGFFKSGYNAIESGHRNVSLLTLYKVAFVLETPISNFFSNKEFYTFLKKFGDSK
ncbi:helix-turn-helix domain-containing protein [Gaetbulibacter aestuarii]|uniref:Helix-turn-helix transcriptional regulator n=1 Tax=Gaetbulibacter aestuarii TaxID=1502358 RepID=A0ABW7N0F4_9FLAO